MKKYVLGIALLGAMVGVRAQSISHVATTKSWYYVYDERGKPLKTISTALGVLKGYSASFYLLQKGKSFLVAYSPKGKPLHTFSVAEVGEILSVTGDTFTSRKGAWCYTWTKDGKKVGTRPAQTR